MNNITKYIIGGIALVALVLSVLNFGTLAVLKEQADGFSRIVNPIVDEIRNFRATIAQMPAPVVNVVSEKISETKEALGGLVTRGMAIFVDGIQLEKVGVNYEVLTLGAGTDTVNWQNKTGKDVTVSDLSIAQIRDIRGNITSSTTIALFAYASSTADVPNNNDFSRLGTVNEKWDEASTTQFLINEEWWATSTYATTTNNLTGLQLWDGLGSVRVPAESYLVIKIQGWEGDPRDGGVACVHNQLAPCEHASSTNRGFDLRAIFKTTWITGR